MKTLIATLVLMSTFLPGFVFAQDTGALDGLRDASNSINSSSNDISREQTTLQNPLRGSDGQIDDVGALFDDILTFIIIPLSIAVGVLFIIIAGLRFVTAQGNPTEIGNARKNLLAVVIGVAIILSAEIILDVLLGTLREIGNV